MFGKKKDGPTAPAPAAQKEADVSDETKDDGGDFSAPPLKPFSRKGSHAPKPPTSSGMASEMHRRPPEVSTTARRIDRARSLDTASDQKRLIEVTLPAARLIEVAPTGVFKGNADVEEADISGRFEGELIARGRLVVRAGGRVQGKIRYGRIVIEQGGEISGDMQTLDEGD